MELIRSVTFVPSFCATLVSTASSSVSSVGVVLVMLTRPRLRQPAECGLTPIRSISASSTSSAPPSAGSMRSLEMIFFPVSSSKQSSRNSSASNMARTIPAQSGGPAADKRVHSGGSAAEIAVC
jgi:hypothetical protein